MTLDPVLLEKLNVAERPAPSPTTIPRDAHLPAISGKSHAVLGMRRSGKTTFLRQLVAARRETVAPERAIYLSFDDDRLADLSGDQLGFLLEEYFRRHPHLRGRQPVHWYLDEIQMVPGWDRFVRRVMDTELLEIVVSGSSARLLSREVHTSLRGRSLPTVIRPFSFREFLRFRGEEPTLPANRWTAAERSQVENRFREFLTEGGFPEAQRLQAPLRIELLQSYVDAVLFRDVVERHQVTQVAALRWLVRHCLRNPGGRFSVHRLCDDLQSQGLGTNRGTVGDLLDHLQDAFLLSAVPIATESERQRNTNPRKLYPADQGLIGAFDTSGRSNHGHALECVVAIEAARRRADLAYVRTVDGFEVDFLVSYLGGPRELLQVCADPGLADTRDRELRALAAAAVLHPRAKPKVLVMTHDQAPLLGDDFEAMPVYEWLLEPPPTA